MLTGEAAALIAAVDEGFDAQVELTVDLVRFPSVRGEERLAQEFMAAQMVKRRLEVDHFQIELDKIRALPGFSPASVSYDNAYNVVGTRRAPDRRGRSLILNGHIDVVPAGPLDMWTSPPFEPRQRRFRERARAQESSVCVAGPRDRRQSPPSARAR